MHFKTQISELLFFLINFIVSVKSLLLAMPDDKLLGDFLIHSLINGKFVSKPDDILINETFAFKILFKLTMSPGVEKNDS